MFTALAAYAMLALAKAEPVMLSRQYKDGQSSVYKVSADVDQSGQDLKLSAVLEYKVKKLLEKGAADVELNATTLDVSVGGSPAPDMGSPGSQMYKGDANGMLKGTQFKQMEALYAIVGICGYVPNKALAVGESYPIEWQSEEFHATGKGTFSEVKELAGKRVAVLKVKVDIVPTGDHAATMEFTSEISLETGMLLNSSGTVTSEEFNAKIKVAPAKAA